METNTSGSVYNVVDGSCLATSQPTTSTWDGTKQITYSGGSSCLNNNILSGHKISSECHPMQLCPLACSNIPLVWNYYYMQLCLSTCSFKHWQVSTMYTCSHAPLPEWLLYAYYGHTILENCAPIEMYRLCSKLYSYTVLICGYIATCGGVPACARQITFSCRQIS